MWILYVEYTAVHYIYSQFDPRALPSDAWLVDWSVLMSARVRARVRIPLPAI